MVLEKTIKFNNKDWLVRIDDCLVQVYDSNEPNKVSGNQIYGNGSIIPCNSTDM
jgi:hypothetical protein